MDQITFLLNILFPALADGLVITLLLIICSAPFGFLLGTGVAVGRAYGGPVTSRLARVFVVFVKGTPLLLLLFILYFGLPSVGLTLDPFEAALIGFIFCNAAYNSEYIRGAMLSVKQGQLIAAEALGMSRFQSIRLIVLPQALRRAIPGISNEFIYLIKYSSLAYMITLVELTGEGKIIAAKYFTYTETFMVVGIVYLILVTFTTIAAHLIEKKVSVPGMSGSSSR